MLLVTHNLDDILGVDDARGQNGSQDRVAGCRAGAEGEGANGRGRGGGADEHPGPRVALLVEPRERGARENGHGVIELAGGVAESVNCVVGVVVGRLAELTGAGDHLAERVLLSHRGFTDKYATSRVIKRSKIYMRG